MRHLRRKKLLVVFFLITFVVLFFLFIFLTKPGQNLVNPIISKTLDVNLEIKNKLEYLEEKAEIIRLNEELQNKIIELSIDSARLSSCLIEKNELEKKLNYFEKQEYGFITTKVIGKFSELDGAQNVYVIDKGKSDGLKIGYPLVVSNKENTDGIIVGKIIKTNHFRSYFILSNNYHSSMAGIILNSGDEKSFLITGTQQGVMEAKYLPVDRRVTEGDLVVTSGLEEFVPRGFLIGQVGFIKKEQGSLFYEIKLDSLVNLDNVRFLNVIIPISTHEEE